MPRHVRRVTACRAPAIGPHGRPTSHGETIHGRRIDDEVLLRFDSVSFGRSAGDKGMPFQVCQASLPLAGTLAQVDVKIRTRALDILESGER
jgi:hypothetical protein